MDSISYVIDFSADEILIFSQTCDVQSIMKLKKGIRFGIVDGFEKALQLTALWVESKANRQFFFGVR